MELKSLMHNIYPSTVIKALEAYWVETKVKDLTTVYCPHFVYVLAEDGSNA